MCANRLQLARDKTDNFFVMDQQARRVVVRIVEINRNPLQLCLIRADGSLFSFNREEQQRRSKEYDEIIQLALQGSCRTRTAMHD